MSIRNVLLLLIAISFSPYSFSQNEKAAPCKRSDPLDWGLASEYSGIHVCGSSRLKKAGSPVRIAVVDTGVDPTVPALSGILVKNSVTGQFGYDLSQAGSDPTDSVGHGTHISGIIAQVFETYYSNDNPLQILSTKWWNGEDAYKLIQKQGINISDITALSIFFAATHGARIINFSGGGNDASESERTAYVVAQRKDILTVVAAGNDGTNLDISKVIYSYYPAEYRLKNMIVVAGITEGGDLGKWSNYGSQVDIAAPGQWIHSYLPGPKEGYMSGTSQATAFVSGVAGILLSQDPKLSAAQLKYLILHSARKIPQLQGKVRTGGVVDLKQAMILLKKMKKQWEKPPIIRKIAIKKKQKTRPHYKWSHHEKAR